MVVYAQELNAQTTIQPYMRWITEDDGLPSNEVYHVIQDDNGFIWLATDDGIVKYDGKNIEVFNKSNGLPENVVFRLYKKDSGELIGECLSNKYFTFFNNTITPFKINDSITKHLGSANLSFSYSQDEKGNHHLGTRYGMYLINKKGNLLESPNVFFPLGSQDTVISGLIISKISNTWIAAKQGFYKNSATSEFNFCLNFSNDYHTNYYNLPNKFMDKFSGNSIHVVEIEQDKLCFNYGRGIILTTKNSIVQTKSFESSVFDLFYHGGYIFVCTQYHGVYQIKVEGNELMLMNHFLDGYSVTSGMRSTDGSFWFTTRERGVVQIPDLGTMVNFKVSDDNIGALFISPKIKIVGTENGLVYLNDKLIHQWSNSITGFLELNHRSYVSLGSTNSPIVFNSNEDRRKWSKFNLQNDYFQIRKGYINGNKLLGIGISNFLIYDFNKNAFVFSRNWGESKREKIHSALFINESFYLAASDGLFELDANKGTIIRKYLSNELICLQKFREGIFGFSQNGEIFYIKGEQVQKFELPKFKMIYRYYTFFVEGNLLIASNNLGVYKWDISDKLEFTLRDFTPLPRINIIQSQENYWYYASKKMVLTETKSQKEQVKPMLLFNSVLINSLKINYSEKNEFDYQSDNVQFNLRTIDFGSKFSYYKYKLDNHDPEYILGSSNSINYSALDPGTYTFRVSVTTDGFRYSNELNYTFTIHPPFWKTTWFVFVAIVVFLTILTSFVFFRIRRYREQYKLEKMIVTLRTQALTTQLNPHLIFNILNSIQGMVSEGDIEQVNTYIAEFSKFMRRTLIMSKQELVSVSEEIENTLQYTELEKLRFIDSVQFDFSIHINDQNLQVPPMIIQPLIENAIKHGIMPKMMKQGKVLVRIQEEKDFLIIQVEDNGVGFQNVPEIFGDGLRITSERLKVISASNNLVIINRINPTIIQITYAK